MELIFKDSASNSDGVAAIAERILKVISPNSILLIEAEVGAGKTTLIVELCKQIGVHQVSSPTFSIHNRYSVDEKIVDHFDLYRIDSDDQLESSGFWDLIDENVSYKMIEWPSRIKNLNYISNDNIYLIKIIREIMTENRIYELFQVKN